MGTSGVGTLDIWMPYCLSVSIIWARRPGTLRASTICVLPDQVTLPWAIASWIAAGRPLMSGSGACDGSGTGGAVGGGGGGGGAAGMVPFAVTICDRVISSARSSISQRSWSSGR